MLARLLAGARDRDRVMAAVGALAGIAVTALVCSWLSIDGFVLPMIVAPMGASAVLLFAVPASPLAQPWSIVGGNIVSAIIGVGVAHMLSATALAAGVAVGGAIVAMSLCRCLHPPGGAVALSVVIGGPAITSLGWAYPLVVAANAIVLLGAGWVFHRLSRRSYPHRAVAPVPAGLHRADIEAALDDLGEGFDITVEDLGALLTRAEAHAATRKP